MMIYEGDLVVMRERDPRFREFIVEIDRLLGHQHDLAMWFSRFGRENGRAWLGVVIRDTGIRVGREEDDPECWMFQSVNMSATIWEYWSNQLEVVQLPEEAKSFIGDPA